MSFILQPLIRKQIDLSWPVAVGPDGITCLSKLAEASALKQFAVLFQNKGTIVRLLHYQ